jgi:YidC/Oxa1 family membrane protein insertase
MQNTRLLIWATFGILLWMTWQQWQIDYGLQPANEPTPTESVDNIEPPNADDALPPLPEQTTAPNADADAPPSLDVAQPEPAEPATDRVINVRTDVLDVDISLRGGTLVRATLLNYPVTKDQPDLVTLLDTSATDLGMIRTGINDAGSGPKADHNANYTTPRNTYELGTSDELVVPLTWTDQQGITVEKNIRLSRGSYRIDVSHRLINRTDTQWRGAEYAQVRRRSHDVERSMFDVDTYSFDGPVVYDGEKSEKLARDDLMSDGPFVREATNGWIAFIQHHFLSAVVPPSTAGYRYNVQINGPVATSSLIPTEAIVVPPGGEHTFATTVFIGPKLQADLEEIAESLKLTVDYGWLTIISQPLFWLLSFVYSFVKNWGVAIIFVTILIKMAFYKLTEASGRSMAKMREIQPRMQALQERYKDDRQALSQAMMELYKREKVNPAAGCLPILIQMPFFLAFYWVLLESVEMRQAPFALWLTDLSARDPYFILPIIMGAAMLGQQKLNPTPADPVQARVMQIMPIMFTVFFAFFPSGLVLYWVTNTLLSIAQQWHINKVVHEEATRKKGGKKPKDKQKSTSA